MSWITAHWAEVLVVLTALHVAARRLVDLTPTDMDNAWLSKLDTILRLIGLKFED